jgi:hypothetical protein
LRTATRAFASSVDGRSPDWIVSHAGSALTLPVPVCRSGRGL